MDDLISRQKAIDIGRNATVDTNPSHFEAHQKFTQFMDDAEISSFGRWQWSNGFNTALTAVGIDLKKLPSVQPEVLACGNGELAAKPEPQWIPVSERLPEKGGEYLVSVHHTIGAISVFHPEKDTYVDDVAIMKYYGKFPSTVRAWMPLPEPYKSEVERRIE